MKMSISRALKERKRLIGEMNTLRSRALNNNVAELTVACSKDGSFAMPTAEAFAEKRNADPAKLMEKWYELRDKLIDLKAQLQAVNIGIARKLVTLSELKSELASIEGSPRYDNVSIRCTEELMRVRDVVFDSAWSFAKEDGLRKEINQLQDEIDEYNATHYIEVAD